jgi:hypothetical protein
MQDQSLGRNGHNFGWIDQDEPALLTTILEADDAADESEQGVVFPASDACAGLERCSTLPYDDAATKNCLAAKYLDTKPLSV